VGQPILAAAAFQAAFFVSLFAGFCRKRRSRQGSSLTRVKAIFSQLLSLRGDFREIPESAEAPLIPKPYGQIAQPGIFKRQKWDIHDKDALVFQPSDYSHSLRARTAPCE
jgi:hypothetical protein